MELTTILNRCHHSGVLSTSTPQHRSQNEQSPRPGSRGGNRPYETRGARPGPEEVPLAAAQTQLECFTLKVPFKDSEAKKKEYYQILSSMVKQEMIDNNLKLNIR